MSSGGAEALKSAIRRSLPVIIGLVVLGVLAMNVFKHLQGARYEATSRVEVSTTPLSSIITGTQPAFVDPQRVQDTAQVLAGSPQVYQLAEQQTAGRLGTAGDMKSATTVAAVPNTDILSFTASSPASRRSIATANAVAAAYIAFRTRVSNLDVNATIAKLQATLASLPPGSPQRQQAQQELNRLQLLRGVTSSDAVLVQRAVSAVQTSPAPLKDSVIGFSLGLVIALMVVALREAVDTTVRSERDVEDLLSAPVLATVRSLPRRTWIVTYGRHQAAFADTYALLAAQLTRSTGDSSGHTLAVTSAVAGEGKTTTATNLAIAAARRGINVLLADLDFRKPAVSKVFDIPRSARGALQVLDGTDTLDSVLWAVSLGDSWPTASLVGADYDPAQSHGNAAPDPKRTRKPNSVPTSNGSRARPLGTLRVLPSGGTAPSLPAQKSRLSLFLGELQANADLVILDTAPALLTAEMTELAELVDTVLVVVRQGRVSQRVLRNLGRHAHAWPAELAGAVLTDVPAADDHNRYYYAKAR